MPINTENFIFDEANGEKHSNKRTPMRPHPMYLNVNVCITCAMNLRRRFSPS